MCGRFTFTNPDELVEHYGLTNIPADIKPRYNIAPGQMVTAIINDGKQNRIGQLKWGLIPSWAKDEKMAYKTINAKAETLMEKPAFKVPFMRKRCIISADGFYEWKKTDSSKQPMRILMKDKRIFSFAGLYDTWMNISCEKVSTCTIITTKPNQLVADIHDRMPVILRREDEQLWMNRDVQDMGFLQSLLVPYSAEGMYAYPVSAVVGNVKNEGTECIEYQH